MNMTYLKTINPKTEYGLISYLGQPIYETYNRLKLQMLLFLDTSPYYSSTYLFNVVAKNVERLFLELNKKSVFIGSKRNFYKIVTQLSENDFTKQEINILNVIPLIIDNKASFVMQPKQMQFYCLSWMRCVFKYIKLKYQGAKFIKELDAYIELLSTDGEELKWN